MTRQTKIVAILLAILILPVAALSQDDASLETWAQKFGYKQEEIHKVSLRRSNFPFITVTINGTDVELLFDTGNMTGLALHSRIAQSLKLPVVDTWNLYSAAGEKIGTANVYAASTVTALGMKIDENRFNGRDSFDLDGLFGPKFLLGKRFTLDYANSLMAVSASKVPETLEGEELALHLIDSYAGMLVLKGKVNGREILMQLDTGKSRSVVDPALVEALKLEENSRGAKLNSVVIGSYEFSVPSAKIKSFKGISKRYPQPILLGVGADILSQLTITVDYPRGRIILQK